MKEAIRAAYAKVREEWSADRVVADPDLNARFVAACRAQGLPQPISELNQGLLNARKAGWLSGLGRSKKTTFDNEGEYRFASEVATRFLEQRDSVTLDQIICDPIRANEFDEIAARIAPGFTPLQYRWAALNLRKSKKLQPELLSRIAPSDFVRLGAIDEIDSLDIPTEQGLYIFYGPVEPLYIGESANLRKRIAKHLDHSDNKGLAHWFWGNGFTHVMLEVRVLPRTITQKVRKALEIELIRSRKPRFNIFMGP